MTSAKTNGSTWKSILMVVEVLLVIALPLIGWIAAKTVDQEARLSTIEGNRFTSADGMKIHEELTNIWRMVEKMPTEVPPAWFKERVDKIDLQVQKNTEMLARNAEMISRNNEVLARNNSLLEALSEP